MNKFTLHLLSAALLTSASMVAYAADKPTTPSKDPELVEIKVGAGNETGEYFQTVVPAISKALAQYGYKATAVVSAGSQENIDRVKAGEIHAGLSQLDVAALNVSKDKNYGDLLFLGRIAPEALFCAVKKEGNIKNYVDLTDKQKTTPIKVTVMGEKSGTAATLTYLMTIDPALTTANKGLELVYSTETIKDELQRLTAGNREMVCFMMMPNPENETIKLVSGNVDLMFLSFDNEDLMKKARVGELQVYDIMDVTSGSNWGLTTKLKTLVTWMSVVVNVKKADPKLVSALRDVTMKPDLLPDGSLLGKTKGMVDKVIHMVQ